MVRDVLSRSRYPAPVLNPESVAGLRKIRAHLRTINDSGSEKRPRRHGGRSRDANSSSKQAHRRHDDDKRRQSVRFDTRPPTYYVPDPPRRYQDVEWPQSAGSIEYFPLKDQFPTKEDDNPVVVRLSRLQRSSSVSYQPTDSPPKARCKSSESTTRCEKERGRSRSRETRGACAHTDTDSSDGSYHRNLGYRSRR